MTAYATRHLLRAVTIAAAGLVVAGGSVAVWLGRAISDAVTWGAD